jgi:hypothetical protein
VSSKNTDPQRDERREAIKAHSLKVQCDVHPDYRAEDGTCERIGRGPLEILKIVRVDDKRHFFRGRWDWERKDPDRPDQLNDALDFDLFIAGQKNEDFERCQNGWSGHHAVRLASNPSTRIFKIEIKSPDGPICEGTASFTLTFQRFADQGSKIRDFIEGTVTRGRSPE